MSLPYCFIVIEDKEEGGYTAFFPDLRDCVTCAETFEELHYMTEDAKKCWIEAELESGHNIPEPSFDYL